MSFWSPRPAGPTAQDRRQGSLQAPGSSALTLAPLQSLPLALPGCSEGLWRGGGALPGSGAHPASGEGPELRSMSRVFQYSLSLPLQNRQESEMKWFAPVSVFPKSRALAPSAASRVCLTELPKS